MSILIECDHFARRVTRNAWPHVEEIKGILDITRETVAGWFNRYPRVTHVHLIGGFPCAHLSSAWVERRNLEGEGSKLFYNLVDLITWCKEVFERVATVDFAWMSRHGKKSAEFWACSLLGSALLISCLRLRLAWTSIKPVPTAK